MLTLATDCGLKFKLSKCIQYNLKYESHQTRCFVIPFLKALAEGQGRKT